ncbi:hypothetical protein [Enterococcus columbae]|uniref:Mga helix-turn-helix domain-containing protein n=1 Tax=Enterococcus columbae DSM 7374 = ATCC 51263 TaxID=1121865 RepID=S1NIS7_9ENTE|nr:hypothetical protein [Enterococcus columbae]EOT41029.1 hypothetical protein OMW_01271 [Enterococcus columbae DSM 7374 = ATCC 51263]EOW80709.1 hypothetical protein I568_01887 [Enterococcus columbae DSM 7374 = ATCC 51263]OJG21344.1 hypothetical protein RR47_GL001406 [Enterococcus columbae DSM 7374 = ATCC 51263]
MLIEKYIEKDIIRQIHLLEILQVTNSCSISQLAKSLKVSCPTIKLDCQKINLLHAKKMPIIKKKATHLRLNLTDDKQLHHIKQQLYQQSLFLKASQIMIQHSFDYLALTHKLHCSISQAFRLKNKLQQYLEESQHQANLLAHFFNQEYFQRCLLLNLYSLTGQNQASTDQASFQLAQLILKQALKEQKLQLDWQSFNQLSIFLAIQLTRAKIQPIYLQQKLSPLPQSIAALGQTIAQLGTHFFTDFHFSNDEQTYLGLYLAFLETKNTNHCTSIAFTWLLDNLALQADYQRMLTHLKITPTQLNKNPLLKKTFEALFLSGLFFPMEQATICSPFATEKILPITQKQQKSLVQLRQLYPSYHFTEQALQQFQLMYALLPTTKRIDYQLYLIAADPIRHAFYHQELSRWVDAKQIHICPKVYTQLNQLDFSQISPKSLIICEQPFHLLQPLNIPIFPVTLTHYKADLQEVLHYLYLNS